MKINDRVDLGNEIDSLIVAHCNSHQCCMEDNKSEIVNDILDLKSPPFDWIRVENKLPKVGELVMWWCEMDKKPFISCLMKECKAEDIDPDSRYWMPLPRAPKESLKIR